MLVCYFQKKALIFAALFIALAFQISFAQWEACNNGLTEKAVYNIAVDGSLIMAATTKGLFLSTDSGDSWSPMNLEGVSTDDVTALAIKGNNLFASCSGTFYRSHDRGKNWVTEQWDIRMTLFAFKEDTMFAVYEEGDDFLVRSTDYGDSWIEDDTEGMGRPIYSLLFNSDSIYAGTDDGIYLTTNYGKSWTAKMYAHVWSLAKIDNYIFAGSDEDGILLSSDNGDTWKEFNKNELPNDHSYLKVNKLIAYGKNLFALVKGYYRKGVYLSTDLGKSWKGYNSGLPDTEFYDMEINNEYLYVASNKYSDAGVFRAKLSDFELASVPDNYTQNDFAIMPNPAKEKISIKYPFNSSALSTINITNELGMVVLRKDLSPGTMNEVIEINMENFLTGSYFCTIISGNKIETRKFCVVK